MRAGIVKRAEDWPWGGLAARTDTRRELKLSPWPVNRPSGWKSLVNDTIPADELALLRAKVNRGQPMGDAQWTQNTARTLGLESTLRRVGRPSEKENQ